MSARPRPWPLPGVDDGDRHLGLVGAAAPPIPLRHADDLVAVEDDEGLVVAVVDQGEVLRDQRGRVGHEREEPLVEALAGQALVGPGDGGQIVRADRPQRQVRERLPAVHRPAP